MHAEVRLAVRRRKGEGGDHAGGERSSRAQLEPAAQVGPDVARAVRGRRDAPRGPLLLGVAREAQLDGDVESAGSEELTDPEPELDAREAGPGADLEGRARGGEVAQRRPDQSVRRVVVAELRPPRLRSMTSARAAKAPATVSPSRMRAFTGPAS